jgi:DNA polymerase-1
VVILIDGHSIAFRAFYALPDSLVTKEGFPTNVIHGFLMMISKIIKDFDTDKLIITWDVSKKTFRTDLYKDYKGNRKSAPDEFKVQVKVLQKLIEKFNIPQVSVEGYEADDVLGTLSKSFNDNNEEVLIVTGDRDSFQLIGDKTNVLYTKRGISEVERFGKAEFEEKYQISTSQYIEYLGLKGDSSDNIPGLPGVGEKTAINLLSDYENIENIYKNLDDLTPKLRDTFQENKDLLMLSKDLATIKRDLDINLPETKIKDSIFFNEEVLDNAKDEIMKYELTRFLGERKDTTQINNSEELEIVLIKEKIADESIIFNFENKNYFVTNNSFGEFESLEQFNNVISMSSQTFALNSEFELDIERFLAFDCCLFLIDPSIKPDNLLNIVSYIDKYSEINKKSNLSEYLLFFQNNFDNIKKQFSDFKKDRKLFQIYNDIDFPMLDILSSMEKDGISVSLPKMKKLSKQLSKELESLSNKCYEITNQEFNLNSPKQLSEIFYNEMNFPVLKKTPKGAPSTDASVLEELSKEHDLPKYILKYRELEKIRSTYVDGLIPEVTKNNKIHTHFNLFGTATGRLSSEKPNLQNIPNKTELGQKIRDFFISKPNFSFIIADYSQIELRVLAHLSQDSTMIEILKNKKSDIHSETASRIFNVPIGDVTSDMRRKAKEVNFGLIYGMEAFGLSKSLDIEQKEASQLIESYFSQFPEIKGFLDNIVLKATKDSFTETLIGRKRYIRELNSSNFQVKAAGKRIAMNAPIQGTAADIMKIAMIKVLHKIKELDQTQLLLQIHDEIIIETKNSLSSKVEKTIISEMEKAMKLDVPLFVNTKVSGSLANFNN